MKNKIIERLAKDAEALVAATKDVAGDQVQDARKSVDSALERAKAFYGHVYDTALDGSTAVNKIVHQNSYQSIAIGVGVGAILGYFIARACKKCCAAQSSVHEE